MIERQEKCPKCKSKNLARCGEFVYCLEHFCDWAIQSKRISDKEIQNTQGFKTDWS